MPTSPPPSPGLPPAGDRIPTPPSRKIARSDVVINLAAICNPSEYIKQPVNTINSNFTDAQDCIKFCVKHNKHLVHFSTCEVYGRTLSS